MDIVKFPEAIDLVEQAVMDAARYLDEAVTSGDKPEVTVKADHTLVMNLDLESQRRILARLGTSMPIVAEEDPSSHEHITSASSYFLVDPLDGTTSCKRFLGQRGGHVGYGPLVGYVRNHVLSIAAFYSVPHRKLFTAVRGEGTYVTTIAPDWKGGGEKRRLQVEPCAALNTAGLLFFISPLGEARVVEYLKANNAIENVYRFGGFANDSARLAQGFEQIQFQLYAKPWDFSAVLLAAEAGCDVICDPLGRRTPLSEWRIERNNPILAVAPGVKDELLSVLAGFK
jgi:fructose-1,6-bisphosphatase/inositol monophosphatase family enzyme